MSKINIINKIKYKIDDMLLSEKISLLKLIKTFKIILVKIMMTKLSYISIQIFDLICIIVAYVNSHVN